MSDKQVLLTYSVLDNLYQNGLVRFAGGLQDAVSGTPTVGTVDNPADTGVPLAATDADPKLFSFAFNGGARMLLAKVATPVPGEASTDTWTVANVPSPAANDWNPLVATDIVLQYPVVNPAPVATNPYGVAQVGDWLYIIDYDSQKIIPLGVDELDNLPSGATAHVLDNAPFDLGPNGVNQLPTNAMGQAIIALSNGTANYLFALYTVSDDPYTKQDEGILVRLTVGSNGALTYNAQVVVGINPQGIVPVTPVTPITASKRSPGSDETALLIPAVGGIQKAGATNGASSTISHVYAFDAIWPATADVLVTGNAKPGANPAYDFHAIAAASRADDNGIVYMLTIDYAANYAGTDWALYSTTVSSLLSKSNTPIASAGFTLVASGTAPAGYFWDILFENGTAATNDRLWFFQGTPLRVSPALAYATNVLFPVGTGTGQIGGQNVDWADLTIETLRQAAAGVSLKRSFRSVIKAPKAAEAEEEK
jgi:hypothetical protein